MAFVLIQHLDPTHKSVLAELISRFTPMPVVEASDGIQVQPNCVYIIPPNHYMVLLAGTLHLLPPENPRGHRLPIDFFFRSLAQDQHERAIGIVLSGTGSDGTLGIRAIKGEGGMAMAQSPESSDFDGMPRNAIATALVDYVLHPSQMPSQLIAFVNQAFRRSPLGELNTEEAVAVPAISPQLSNSTPAQTMAKIFTLIYSSLGHDFSGYKPRTITRRIERRMAIHNIENAEDYLRYLQDTPAEVDALFRDFLIGVTQFFREIETFQALEKDVLPQIFAAKPSGAAIRVWVPACSTGEEAYSIAILLQERLDLLKKNYQLQVFATDIDRNAIATARAGIYPASISADVSPARLARYFISEPETNTYRLTKVIRDTLIFSEQDITRDPPFSRLDLISCRNLLIYLGAGLQKKLIPLFHYALSPNGFLTLGTSEGIGDFSDLFSAIDRKYKIYRRIANTSQTLSPALARYRPLIADDEVSRPLTGLAKESKFSLRDVVEQMLLRQYAPACALVTNKGEICYLHGRTGLYLEPVAGNASFNILKMAREGLRRELAVGLHCAASRNEIFRQSGLLVRSNGHFTNINLEVRPVDVVSSGILGKGLFLVILEPVEELAPGQIASDLPQTSSGTPLSKYTNDSPAAYTDTLPEDSAQAQISILQQEIRVKDEHLQSILEEMETSNEELRSSHEEMQSVNEELQSANEELETSKEELQSVNEELSTVNSELQQRVADLSRANNDMNNLLAGTGIGTIFVDHQLRIQRFTPAAAQVINLIQADIGRPVGHIVSNLVNYSTLVQDIQQVLETLQPKEIEVETHTHHWYLLRLRPYRTLTNIIEGVVITFFEISEMKRSRAEQLRSEARAEQLVSSLPQLVLTFNPQGICDYLSPQWLDYTGIPATEQLGLGWLKLLHPDDRDRAFASWSRSIGTATPLTTEFRLRAKDGSYRHFRCRVAPALDGEAKILRWFGTNTDIEAEKQAESSFLFSEAKRLSLAESIPMGILFLNADGNIIEANSAAEELLGLRADQLLHKSSASFFANATNPQGEPIPWNRFPSHTARISGHPSENLLLSLPAADSTSRIWLQVSATPLFYTGAGAPYPVYTILQRVPAPKDVP